MPLTPKRPTTRPDSDPLTPERHKADPAATLLFDEADALFNKRSSVQDAHDRYSDTAEDKSTPTVPPTKP